MKKDSLTYSFLELKKKLHLCAMGFLHNDADAQDALQDTFVKLWDKGGIKSEAEAGNKLFVALRNLCIDRLRRPGVVPISETPEVFLTAQAEYCEDMENLETLLKTGLTKTQRAVYDCVVHEGLEYEKVASRLNMSVDAVKTNMYRARKRIHENYQKLNR